MADKSLSRAVLAFLFAFIALTTLASCRTTSGSDHDQIVRTAIDLADSYSKADRLEDALDVYDRALAEADDYRLYFNKALILSGLDRKQEAADLCALGFEKYPYILKFKTAQAEFLYAAGNTGLAFQVYNEIMELNPYDSEARKLLIERLLTSGQKNSAYEQALILWNQGCKDKDTIGYLYSIRPDVWSSVYSLMNAENSGSSN